VEVLLQLANFRYLWRHYEETWPKSSPSSIRGPEYDMSRLGIEPGPTRWEESTLAKSYSNSLLIVIRNIYIWACNMAPPVHVLHELNIHEHKWTALASRSTLNIHIIHLYVRLFNVRQDRSRRGHHYEDTWPRSSPSSTKSSENDMSRSGIEPWAPQR
jgi:hypothetical protein